MNNLSQIEKLIIENFNPTLAKLENRVNEAYTLATIEHYKESLLSKNKHAIAHLIAGAPVVIGSPVGNYDPNYDVAVTYLAKIQEYIQDEDLGKALEEINTLEGRDKTMKIQQIKQLIYNKYK